MHPASTSAAAARPLEGYVNVDIAPLEGVDEVFDLRVFPRPLPDNAFDEVRLWDVLEHLPDTIGTIEEIWRVCRDGAVVDIRVPYWNSRWAWMDPQHQRAFHERTFDYFDPATKQGGKRTYYSHARFTADYAVFEGCCFFLGLPWRWKVPGNRPRRLLHAITKLCDMVHFLQFRLRAVKRAEDGA